MIPADPPITEWIRAACLLECTARKPGNVHPQAAFDDVCHADFVKSADVAAPILADASARGVGFCVLEAVRATRDVVGKNTNLGIALLIAPLAAADVSRTLREGVGKILLDLTAEDAAMVYEAIRLADPGGLGRVETGDVARPPTGTLLEMMQLAADRDSVAAQYARGFSDVLTDGVECLGETVAWFPARWEDAIVRLHLEFMAGIPDTLISRKCGSEIAAESARRARQILAAGWPDDERSRRLLRNFDGWLRADGHRRNPGTTADLVTATLYAAMREGKLPLPPGWAVDIVSANGSSD
ncbi:MAG: triphosphoribosyl-dephospho-CoA synthase [Planctomycetaceae bacterium]